MHFHQQKQFTLRSAVAALLSIAFICVPTCAAEKILSKDAARKAITRVAGLELPKDTVRIKEVTETGTTVEVAATIKTAFRLQQTAGGGWRVVELRAGDRQWEEIELLTRALQIERTTPLITQLEALTAQFAERERIRAEKKKRHKEKDEPADNMQTKKKPPPAPPVSDDDLRAGPFVIKSFAPLLSSATVETEIDTLFRLNKDARGQWQVTAAKIGDSAWADTSALVRALDAEKATRAQADLAALAAALEAFRRERGFYVVADSAAALVDQLNPRYTDAIIRIDPWHRPYAYTGTRASFDLRSLGPDGKANTTDDVVNSHADR